MNSTPRTPMTAGIPVTSLLSPPTQVDSFQDSVPRTPSSSITGNTGSLAPTMSSKKRSAAKSSSATYASPPISPATEDGEQDNDVVHKERGPVNDPLLYDDVSMDEATSKIILFPESEPPTSPSVNDEEITKHIALSRNDLSKVGRPSLTEYQLWAECSNTLFKSNVMNLYKQDPRAYATREKEFFSRYTFHKPGGDRRLLKTLAPAKSSPRTSKKIGAAMPGVKKSRRTGRSELKAITPFDDLDDVPTPTKKTKPRTTGMKNADCKFWEVPNVTPPVSQAFYDDPFFMVSHLGVKEKKAVGQFDPNDSHRHLLSPAEQLFADHHRLTGDVYLTQKRRILLGRLEYLRLNKDFKKTHAQTSAKIDVNKASKLWEGFQRAGWFAPEHFTKWLHTNPPLDSRP